jgi:hypothetical protein
LPHLTTRFFNHLKRLHGHKYASDEEDEDAEHMWLCIGGGGTLVDGTKKILDQVTNIQRSFEITLKIGNAFVVVWSLQGKATINYPYF